MEYNKRVGSNRTVEVNEMWNIRQKELELDKRINNKRMRDDRSSHFETSRSMKNVHNNTNDNTASCSTSKRVIEDYSTGEEDERCLKDEEVEEFLHSRIKRGRGAVGSRMDETGPYLPKQEFSSRSHEWASVEEPDRRALVGPKKPISLRRRSCESSEDEESSGDRKRRKEKKVHSRKSKHKSEEKSRRDKKKERKDKNKKKHKGSYK